MSAAAPQSAPLDAPTWAELEALLAEADEKDALPAESFAAVVPEIPDEVPEEERRAELRRALGGRAPEWAIDLGVANGTVCFEGEAGELLRDAVTLCVFTDRGPVLRRLAAYLMSRSVDRLLVLALLHGWAVHFCAPVPFEDEVRAVVADAWEEVGGAS